MATAANAISPEGRQQRPHDLVVPPWAEALPCCLFVLVKFFYLDLLLPDDTFVAAMRKALIAIGPWAFFCAPFLNAVLRLIRDGDKIGSEPNVAVGLLLALGIWAPLYLGIFTFAKCQPHRAGSGAITDLWTLGSGVGVLLTIVCSSPTMAWHVVLAMTMYLAIMCRAPRRVITCIVCGLASLVSMYNRNAYDLPDDPRLPLLAAPGLIEHRAHTLRSDMVLFLLHVPMLICFEVVLRESDRRHAASRASAELAKKLATALALYDTKKASEALDEAESSPAAGQDAEGKPSETHQADPELVEGFRAIVRNLDEYRPHLPNWLVNKHSASGSGGSRTDDEAPLPLADSDEEAQSFRRALSDDEKSVTTRSRRSSVVSSPSDPQPRHSASRRRRAVGIVPGAPSYAIGDGYAAEHPPAVPQLRTVAMAELRFTLRELRTDGPHGTRRLMALHGFVDRVHEVARATKAAVHAFVGDAVVASWNAARACAHPEAKAARFAARLRTDPALQVTGAVVSGMGTVLMAGLGEQRALVLSLQADAQALLRRAAYQGTRRNAVLLPASMAATVEFAVEHELGAVLYSGDDETAARKHDADGHAPVDPSSVLVLHGIMREVPPERDDWVYVLEQQQGSAGLSSSGFPPEPQPAAGSQKLQSVADAVCAGRFSEALALLNAAAPPEGSPEHAAHAMLHQDIQEVARRSSAAR